jgi:arylsulfatase A-like enzyme
VPALKGKALPARPYFYWEFHEQGFSQAVRLGDWKGIRQKSRRNPIELFDLKTDLAEEHDMAAAHPDLVNKIAGIMERARVDSPDFPVTGSV